MDASAMTTMMCVPTYWRLLLNPAVTTVLITGCGGGFDFVHSGTIVPQLLAAGKKVVIGSYSFGDPRRILNAETVWRSTPKDKYTDAAEAVRVTSICVPDRNYGPEVGMCEYLEEHFPREAGAPEQWSVYAFYAREFTVVELLHLYRHLCALHKVDAVLTVDGGSDSLMKCDESGLGDPIEDAVSVATARCLDLTDEQLRSEGLDVSFQASVRVPTATPDEEEIFTMTPLQSLPGPLLHAKVLITIGVGCDRFNEVTDAATLRAVAELTSMTNPRNQLSGFLGSMALEPNSPLTQHYRQLVEHLESMAFFRSVIANSICAASRGAFGSDTVPTELRRRVKPGELFLWPFMAYHFAFDVETVYDRSLLCKRLLPCKTVNAMYAELQALRQQLQEAGTLRPVEKLPTPV